MPGDSSNDPYRQAPAETDQHQQEAARLPAALRNIAGQLEAAFQEGRRIGHAEERRALGLEPAAAGPRHRRTGRPYLRPIQGGIAGVAAAAGLRLTGVARSASGAGAAFTRHTAPMAAGAALVTAAGVTGVILLPAGPHVTAPPAAAAPPSAPARAGTVPPAVPPAPARHVSAPAAAVKAAQPAPSTSLPSAALRASQAPAAVLPVPPVGVSVSAAGIRAAVRTGSDGVRVRVTLPLIGRHRQQQAGTGGISIHLGGGYPSVTGVPGSWDLGGISQRITGITGGFGGFGGFGG